MKLKRKLCNIEISQNRRIKRMNGNHKRRVLGILLVAMLMLPMAVHANPNPNSQWNNGHNGNSSCSNSRYFTNVNFEDLPEEWEITEKHDELTDCELLEIIYDGNRENLEEIGIVYFDQDVEVANGLIIATTEITQLLVSAEHEDGNKLASYSATTFANIQPLVGGGTLSNWGTDSSGATRVTVGIEFRRSTINTQQFVNLTRVTGTVTRPSPNRISVSAATFTFGQTGFTPNNGFRQQSQIVNSFVGPLGGTISRVPPTNWLPISDNITSSIGANASVTLSMESQTWRVPIVQTNLW